MKKLCVNIPKNFDHLNFLSKIRISKENDCWNWNSGIDKTGYGYFHIIIGGKHKKFRAHRVSYLIFKGKIKNNLVIDHICRNKSCVNPDHLRQVLLGINSIENSIGITALNCLKKFCIHGHLLNKKNTYIYTNKKGKKKRICRKCCCIRSANQRRRNAK